MDECTPAVPPHLYSLATHPTTHPIAHPPAHTRSRPPATPGMMQENAGGPGRPAASAAAPPPPPAQQQQPAEVQGGGLILTDLVPDALALVYDCLPSKEDRRSLLHSCRAKVGVEGWVCTI